MVVDNDWTYLYADALNSPSDRRFSSEALVVAIGPNLVVTAHRKPIEFLTRLLENEAGYLRIGNLHAGSFAASLLDRMLTDYLDARDAFESTLDRIELLVLRRPQARHLSELQQLRRQASKLRRYLAVQRDMFDALARPDFGGGQTDEVARHWQLLSARYARTMTAAESARELVNGSFDVYASRVAQGTNETMRVLTVVTVVLGTLAVVAGVMGMNFRADVFDSGDAGFWWSVAGMLAFAVAAITVSVGWNLLRRRK
jgi:Mg2+ and Co2+ transporter CorA